ncbi:MAG: DUF3667 domain-containing protein [Saprospiraceae bacterium]|nr:DUF3667 domain-containing protein [Saprospiraceae bacterium]
MNCKNCGHIVDGKFCSNCGQNSKVGRINLPAILNEFSESIFQINKGFFYTLRELCTRPGKSIREFLHGKRKNHFKPIAYVLTLSTLYFLITQVTNQNTWAEDIMTGWMNGATEQNAGAGIPKIATWFAKNYAYTALMLLPLFSLASYLSFFKFGKNYFEHFVINSYITGQQAILYALFAIVETVAKSDAVEAFSLLGVITYTFWVFWQFFSEGNRTMNILRSIMTYILYLIFSLGLLLVLMGLKEW